MKCDKETSELIRKIRKYNKDKPITEEEVLKLEIARELGLFQKIKEVGFGGLTSRETGRIGGIITARKKLNGK